APASASRPPQTKVATARGRRSSRTICAFMPSPPPKAAASASASETGSSPAASAHISAAAPARASAGSTNRGRRARVMRGADAARAQPSPDSARRPAHADEDVRAIGVVAARDLVVLVEQVVGPHLQPPVGRDLVVRVGVEQAVAGEAVGVGLVLVAVVRTVPFQAPVPGAGALVEAGEAGHLRAPRQAVAVAVLGLEVIDAGLQII